MKDYSYILALYISLFFLEVIFGITSFYTLGEINQIYFITLMLIINIISFLLIKLSQKLSLLVTSAFASLLVIIQVFYAYEYISINKEIKKIVSHLHNYHYENNKYPINLDNYTWTKKTSKDNIRYYHDNFDCIEYCIEYNFTFSSTSHFYTPSQGWSYYPD